MIWMEVIVRIIIEYKNFLQSEKMENMKDFMKKKKVQMGIEIQGGQRIIIKVKNEGKKDMEKNENIMRKSMEEIGYGNKVVEGEGRNKIRVEVKGI